MNPAVESNTFDLTRDNIDALDTWVEQVGAQWGQTQRTVFQTRLCVAELAANVIEHGIARTCDEQIVVTLHQCGDGIGVEFSDSCAPFDPTRDVVEARAASIESVSPRGRGLLLLRAYAKDFSYMNDGACNRVTLKISVSA